MLQKLFSFSLGLLTFFQSACGQNNDSANRLGHSQNPKFDQEIATWLSFKVPAIDVDSLRKMPPGSVFLLDAREPGEYAVSHIQGAINSGYDHFDQTLLDSLDKTRPVVVYCSIGYRSEKIAQKLKKAGFTNVSNLYGSIFEWVNRGYPVVDASGRATPRIHTYNKKWGKWVNCPGCEKVTGNAATQPKK